MPNGARAVTRVAKFGGPDSEFDPTLKEMFLPIWIYSQRVERFLEVGSSVVGSCCAKMFKHTRLHCYNISFQFIILKLATSYS